MPIYKVLLPSEWAEFESCGQFAGSAADRTDGFVHCSSRAQVGATAVRFFAREPALVVVALDPEVMAGSVLMGRPG